MIAPLGAPTSARTALGGETFHAWGRCCIERGFATTVGDEGGYAPSLAEQRGRHRGGAGGHRTRRLRARQPDRDRARPRHHGARGRCATRCPGGADAVAGAAIGFWMDWFDRYPIVSLEDGLAEDDWDAWRH